MAEILHFHGLHRDTIEPDSHTLTIRLDDVTYKRLQVYAQSHLMMTDAAVAKLLKERLDPRRR